MRRAGCAALVLIASACDRPADPAAPIQITNSGTGAYEAALAVHGDGIVAAWYDDRDGNAEIYMRWLDASGRPAGPERRLTNGPEESYEASIDSLGQAVAVAWYDKSSDEAIVPKLGVWEPDGRNRWVTSLSARGRNPVVSTRDGRIFCAWIAREGNEEWIWAGWWSGDGHVQATPQRLAPAGQTTWNVNAVALDAGRALIAFDATAGTRADELFLVRFDPAGSRVDRLTSDDGRPSKYPDIAVAGRVGLTWFDERDGNEEIYLLTGDEAAFDGDIDSRARRVTYTPGASIGAYLRWGADGRLGVAWSDDSSGQHEIYFQRFEADGRPLSGPHLVTRTPTSSLVPAIRAWREGFALAWNEFKPGAEAHAGTSEIAFALVGGPKP